MKKHKALILGSGTNLLRREDLSKHKDLNEFYIFGGNLCFLAYDLDYFFSSYYIHSELCALHNKKTKIIKFSTSQEIKRYQNEFIKTIYDDLIGLHPGLISEGFVSTEYNQIIGMTHFATSLGINEIVYSGFNQNDYKYFWQSDHESIKRLDYLLNEMYKKFQNTGYIVSEIDKGVLRNILSHKDNSGDYEEYKFYNKSIIKAMFSDLETFNIKFSCYDQCGIVQDILSENIQ